MSMQCFHPEQTTENFRVDQDVTYNWAYDNDRQRLTRLYENAKRDQWNGTDRLDWSVDVDPVSELVPDMAIGIYGSEMWNKLSKKEIETLRHEAITWQLCQFLHGEQGALLATAQIVDSAAWFEAKQYGATQVMDEARQSRPQETTRHDPHRFPMGHEVFGHADHGRRPGARSVRFDARHDNQLTAA